MRGMQEEGPECHEAGAGQSSFTQVHGRGKAKNKTIKNKSSVKRLKDLYKGTNV